jgi:DNA-binding transcriptional regulator YhcF (GntR family)
MVPLTMRSAPLNGADWSVYITLDGMQGDKEFCWPSINFIAEVTKQSRNSVTRAVEKLENLGFLTVRRKRGSGNKYFVLNGARRAGQEFQPLPEWAVKNVKKNNLMSKVDSKETH